jgi:hypothetical protein
VDEKTWGPPVSDPRVFPLSSTVRLAGRVMTRPYQDEIVYVAGGGAGRHRPIPFAEVRAGIDSIPLYRAILLRIRSATGGAGRDRPLPGTNSSFPHGTSVSSAPAGDD